MTRTFVSLTLQVNNKYNAVILRVIRFLQSFFVRDGAVHAAFIIFRSYFANINLQNST